MVAWRAAQARTREQADREAASEMREWAKPIPQTDYMAMRQAFAQKFGKPEDKHVPAKEYMERKLRELETGEFRAEPLNEVLSRDEIDPDTLVPQWDSKGTSLRAQKGYLEGGYAVGPAQLRLRLTVMLIVLACCLAERRATALLPHDEKEGFRGSTSVRVRRLFGAFRVLPCYCMVSVSHFRLQRILLRSVTCVTWLITVQQPRYYVDMQLRLLLWARTEMQTRMLPQGGLLFRRGGGTGPGRGGGFLNSGTASVEASGLAETITFWVAQGQVSHAALPQILPAVQGQPSPDRACRSPTLHIFHDGAGV